METYIQFIGGLLCAFIASSGFWGYLLHRSEKRAAQQNENSVEREMLRGLAHDRILELGMFYIHRGWITKDEYENLHDYLYVPYRKLKGNGSAEKVMKEVDKLPLKDDSTATVTVQ